MMYVVHGNVHARNATVRELKKDVLSSSVAFISNDVVSESKRFESPPMFDEKWLLFFVGNASANVIKVLKTLAADVIFLSEKVDSARELCYNLELNGIKFGYFNLADKDKLELLEFVKNTLKGITTKNAETILRRCGNYAPRVMKVVETLKPLKDIKSADITHALADINLGSFLDLYCLMLGVDQNKSRKKNAVKLLYNFRFAPEYVLKSLCDISATYCKLFSDIHTGSLTTTRILDYASGSKLPIWKLKLALVWYNEIPYSRIYLLDTSLSMCVPDTFGLYKILSMCGDV